MNKPTLCVPLSLLSGIALVTGLIAQQPQLTVFPRAISRQLPTTTIGWSMFGRPGDLFVLLADDQPGHTSLFGRDFDLAFSPDLMLLTIGVFGFNPASYSVSVQPPTLPAGVTIYTQFASWDVAQGFGSLLASNADSLSTHNGASALVFSFENMNAWPEPMTGVFDTSAQSRLQALPATTRQVRPLPPQAFPLPWTSPQQPLNPSGSRFQLAFRASDLGAVGVPEQLVAVHWRPLFGSVAAETYPQFELRAAHSDIVPNYQIDAQTNNPAFPGSGLQAQFAQNPRPGTTPVTLFSGQYDIQPQQLSATGYLPFPTLQQGFDYDGASTLLLETDCSPRPGLGTPQNFQVMYRLLLGVAQAPGATLYASAGLNGQPSPLQPGTATSGTVEATLYDWELEFVRTRSVATSPFFLTAWTNPQYQTPIAASYTPTGTSIQIEYRGAATPTSVPTAWSPTPGIANGLSYLQFRVTMQANAATGEVPWIDTLILPLQ